MMITLFKNVKMIEKHIISTRNVNSDNMLVINRKQIKEISEGEMSNVKPISIIFH